MQMTRKAMLMCMLCTLSSAGVVLALDQLPDIDQVDIHDFAGETWYRASLLGKPVGYSHSSGTIIDAPEGPRLRAIERMALKIDFGQGPTDVKAATTTEYGADLKPVRQRSVQDEFGRPKVVDAVRDGNTLHVTIEAGGDVRTKDLKVSPTFGSELLLSIAAAQGKLPDQATYVLQSFVPELEMLVDFTVECLGREQVTVKGERVEALRVQYAAKEIGLEMYWWVDARGEIVRQEIPAMMGLVLEKVTEEEALAALTPLVLSDHIPVEKSMSSARRLTYVRLKATSPGIPAIELLPEMPLQHIAALGEGDAEVEVKAETELGLEGRKLPFRGRHLREYLSPTDIVQSDDPAIIAKATDIVGDETDAWKAASKLVMWLYRNMRKVDHDPRPITASECLTLMEGDCSEHAVLLCALARAAGIPSKFVTGVVYMDQGNKRGYFYHAWNELYIGRWVSVDPTWGETTANAGHLALASGSLTAESFAKTNMSAVRSMGVLELEVLDYRTK